MLCYDPLESELGPKVHGAPNLLIEGPELPVLPPCSAANAYIRLFNKASYLLIYFLKHRIAALCSLISGKNSFY